jgi:hypothetical protein
MILAARRSQLFQEHLVPTEGGEVLHAKLMLPKPPSYPERLVFMPPLVGGGASQALILFRNLTRRGSVLMSFEYRGHAHSSGTFELDKTIVDTRCALEWACEYVRNHTLPLHGLAMCFGTVPLVAQYADGDPGYPLWSFSTVSGLLRLDQILRFEDFVPVLSRHVGNRLDRTAMLEGLIRQTLDVNGDAFRDALQEYLTGVFPELRVGRDSFEELHYDRADIARTLVQLSRARYLDEVDFPPEISCNFFAGRNDHLLGLHTEEGRAAYRDQVLSLIPHAELHEMDIDHYGRGPDHRAVIERLGDLFERCEQRMVLKNWSRETSTLPSSIDACTVNDPGRPASGRREPAPLGRPRALAAQT